MDLGATLPVLLGLAWLLPLASFMLIVLFGPRMGPHGKYAAYVATGAIVSGFVLSAAALLLWMVQTPPTRANAEAIAEEGQMPGHANPVGPIPKSGAGAEAAHGNGKEAEKPVGPTYYAGDWYSLAVIGAGSMPGRTTAGAVPNGATRSASGAAKASGAATSSFRPLKLTIGYYIDALTLIMFAMITLIASCIHFYTMGYMHDELHDVTDHEVTLSDGQQLHRPGRYHRFFQYLSLFCFSMLGLVIAGNIFMVFVFWELVGICSYFLIGFYIERKSACNAANKAFIVNRVGDFGMIIGLMALWGGLGTFAFGDTKNVAGQTEHGIFSMVRAPANDYRLQPPPEMVRESAATILPGLIAEVTADHTANGDPEAAQSELESRLAQLRDGQGTLLAANGESQDVKTHYGYGLLVIAGLGIFCGCVGKSAQFPLHVWLPDAMEGPTPVSALVHSATMVAAGVYLVGRFYPVFTPEVLLVIATAGCITLALAATIAMTAVDIKRVLAYSTVSQLGYMMLALGVGGWVAGLFHLITHAFFKSLLFLCSGSVIHGCHTNDMRRMGGLRKKMPITAYTMLVGCLAIIGAGIPFVIGLSGYYSKDSIIAQSLSFMKVNRSPWCGVFFYVAVGGAALTAFYMFRLWYMTFAGEPRDQHVDEHVHESPRVMLVPLLVLATMAIIVGWPLLGGVTNLLEQARPAGTAETVLGGVYASSVVYPGEHLSHAEVVHSAATWSATATALAGLLLATIIYCWRLLDPDEIRNQFGFVYRLFWNKWYFDEIYDVVFVQPVLFVSRRVSDFDRHVIDRLVDGAAYAVRRVSVLDDMIDRLFVDGLVNLTARWIHSAGISLRRVQSGRLRQYVMLIIVGTVGLFVLISFFWNSAWGAN
jgi:NADH-quinone oxidoreductase subunit L